MWLIYETVKKSDCRKKIQKRRSHSELSLNQTKTCSMCVKAQKSSECFDTQLKMGLTPPRGQHGASGLERGHGTERLLQEVSGT